MCTDEDYALKKFYGPFLWTGLTYLEILHHYWAVDYFHSYFSQMPKPLSYSSYILRIEKVRQYWLNYSDDLLVKFHETSDTFSNIDIRGDVSLWMKICKQRIKTWWKRQKIWNNWKEFKNIWNFFEITLRISSYLFFKGVVPSKIKLFLYYSP